MNDTSSSIKKACFIVVGVLCSVTAVADFNSDLQVLTQDTHTMVFIGLNFLLTVYFAGLRFDRFAVVHGPEILTTAGIFGCFYGIATALLRFDTTNVAASVPHLLEGVKTAFWASLTGVGGALVIRVRHRLSRQPIQQSAGFPKAATLDDLVAVALKLQAGLVGDEKDTLLSHIKLMRQEQADHHRRMCESFDRFAEKMAENNSRALVDALREVIRDFNAKINEQFGENFKHLNAAVEKLVVWQRQYKEELDQLKTVQAQSSADMKSAAEAFRVVVAQSESFAATADLMEEVLVSLDANLKRSLESERALHAVLTEMKDVAPQFAKRLEELARDMRTGVEGFQQQTREVVKNLGVQLQSAQGEMNQLISETLSKAQRQTDEELRKSAAALKESVLALDRALQKALNDSLETLGRQLASLSEKFVEDYGPLTDRLREVVRMSEKL